MPTIFPNSARCAVSLTYDDGLISHLEDVGPTLEDFGLRGTFNMPIARSSVMQNVAAWREIAARGHELGNHSLFHPCRSEPSAIMEWLDPAYNLVDYNERRLRDELETASFVLKLIDGQSERTYANTCWHRTFGSGDQQQPMEPILEDYFLAARGRLSSQPVDLENIAFMNLGSIHADQHTFAALQAQVEALAQSGGWIIYTMHGVGLGTHSLFIDRDEHHQFVAWLGQNKSAIWTAPMIEVVRFLKDKSVPNTESQRHRKK
jgi:peptidoglycan/xylan/chitin deacetylase (PgdA/CDA1 family)